MKELHHFFTAQLSCALSQCFFPEGGIEVIVGSGGTRWIVKGPSGDSEIGRKLV